MICTMAMEPVDTRFYLDQRVAEAMAFMVDNHAEWVPVLARDERFAGMLGSDHLMRHILPHTLTTVGTGVRRAAMPGASFLDESVEEMQERLTELCAQNLGDMLDSDVRSVMADTPLVDALMLIKGKQSVVPVVGKKGNLLGLISFFSVLRVLGGPPRCSNADAHQ